MRTGVFAAIFAAGCGFSAGGAASSDGALGIDTPHATDGKLVDGSGPDAKEIDATPPPALCSDSAVQLCIDFESAPPYADRSANSIAIAQTAVGPTTRQHPDLTSEGAGAFIVTSSFIAAEAPALDIADALTFDLYMYSLAAPTGNDHAWMVDNNTQYFASYGNDRKVRCGVWTNHGSPQMIDSNRAYDPGAWHHVACTYDKTTLKVYVDGDLEGCKNISGAPKPIVTDGGEGTAVGGNVQAGGAIQDRFLGDLDNVRVFSRVLTDQQVCAAAGRTGCDTGC